MVRDILRIAVPASIQSIEPWRSLNSTESNLLRLTYDSLLHPAQQFTRGDLARVEVNAEQVTVHVPNDLVYADGYGIDISSVIHPIVMRLESFNIPYSLIRREHSFTITGVNPEVMLDILRSPLAVPFRLGNYGENLLGSHPVTSGRLTIAAVGDKRISLVPNPRHSNPVTLRQIDIVQMTDPSALRASFAADEIDIMVVAADEYDILEGREPATQNGYLVSQPSNAISMLSVRPEGRLADPQLRHLLSRCFPRKAFQKRFLGTEGRIAFGFSAATRYAGWDDLEEPLKRKAKQTPEIEFIVPPSERTVYRAHWLAEGIYRSIGFRLRVTPLPWTQYWNATADPGAGDLLWSGIEVEQDHPRDWLLYNLFDTWLPLPPSIEPLRRQAWSYASDEQVLLAVEQQLLADGWVIPLYHHYQTYLVRRGLQGFIVEASDWPLPGVHHVSELRWE